MRTRRTALAAAFITAAIAVPINIAAAAPSSGAADEMTSSGGQDYVVVYDTAVDAAVARASIADAGGTIVDEYSFGVARVAADQGFAKAVRELAGIAGVARNQSIGGVRPGMPHKFSEERPQATEDYWPGNTTPPPGVATGALKEGKKKSGTEPLSPLQWDMKMMGVPEAHEVTKGAGVLVGVIDTGIDGRHPDLAANFDAALSRNFTTDMPDIDGPCEVEPDQSCNDDPDIDEGGHGTHVAGTIAAAANGIGIAGVAPEATLVNVRAGQDSGYFFLAPTIAALEYAGEAGLDVVNMSFYTDPWLYNCASPDDVLDTTDPAMLDQAKADVTEQAAIREAILRAVASAREAGVTLVAAAGNGATDLATPTRFDATSPDYPGGTEYERTVTDNCLDLPSEAPGVIQVSALGPSAAKSDYSNYGLGEIDVSAPGGWFRDGFGTSWFRNPANMILSTYPVDVAREEGGVNRGGGLIDHDFYVRDCAPGGVCGYYQFLQGTSMASPHVAGVAALIIAANGGSMDPDDVAAVLQTTATNHACPTPPTVDYTIVGRPASWTATCVGDADYNGFYGHGIVNAAAAVS